ncbi:MAG TPA: BON domain-containing protein [Blastocatellia bacterium]|nr:BON domain-containing protein [Blastocatellia bacterium]
MNPNERFEQQHVVTSQPSDPEVIVTKSVHEGPREVSLSPATILVIVVLAILAIGTVFYVVNNKNQNEEANRQAALEASRVQAEAQARAQQSVPVQQPPVVIQQQPAPSQAPPVIIQQPAAPATTTETKTGPDDMTLQELASRRLSDETNLSSVTVTVMNGKAHLMGTVDSSDLKTKAERVVKAVRGIKSVENEITVSGQ